MVINILPKSRYSWNNMIFGQNWLINRCFTISNWLIVVFPKLFGHIFRNRILILGASCKPVSTYLTLCCTKYYNSPRVSLIYQRSFHSSWQVISLYPPLVCSSSYVVFAHQSHFRIRVFQSTNLIYGHWLYWKQSFSLSIWRWLKKSKKKAQIYGSHEIIRYIDWSHIFL